MTDECTGYVLQWMSLSQRYFFTYLVTAVCDDSAFTLQDFVARTYQHIIQDSKCTFGCSMNSG